MNIHTGTEVADLHLHSLFSDGVYTSQRLVERAVQVGLDCIALTDHDTLEGCEETERICAKKGIEFIPGVELTAYYLEEEIHVLGYCMDLHNEAFLKSLQKFQKGRQYRVEKMVSLLNKQGVPLSLERVLQIAQCKAPGRAHMARALLEGGFCSSHSEVYSRYLGKGKPAWVPKIYCGLEESIELLHQSGGVAIIAHPGALVQQEAVIKHSIEFGVDGFECYHPKNSASTTQKLLSNCEKHGLLVTGGSDCHGIKERLSMGSIKLPIRHVERLNQWVYSKNLKQA